MPKNSFHVVRSPSGGWAVKKANSTRASKTFDTKEDAILWGKQISKSDSAEFVIHRGDGTIESRNSFGSETFPASDRSSRK